MYYFNPLFEVVTLQAILYLIVLFGLSWDYRKYLLSDNPRTTRQRIYSILTFSLFTFGVFFVITTPLLLYVARYICILVVVLVAIVAVLVVSLVRQQYFSGCLEERKKELDGIKFIVCRSRGVNAWYIRGRIYVSLLLEEMLSKEELRAVIHHELGHGKHSRLSLLGYLVDAYWIEAVITIALLLTLSNEVSVSSILTTLFLLLLGASLTLPVMMISWIDEHEADREAIRGAGPRHFMTAIIKIHVYSSFGELLDDVKVKDAEEIKKAVNASIQPGRIFLTLLKYSWNFPKQIQDLFTSPQYRTHPPLQLRLALATCSA